MDLYKTCNRIIGVEEIFAGGGFIAMETFLFEFYSKFKNSPQMDFSDHALIYIALTTGTLMGYFFISNGLKTVIHGDPPMENLTKLFEKLRRREKGNLEKDVESHRKKDHQNLD